MSSVLLGDAQKVPQLILYGLCLRGFVICGNINALFIFLSISSEDIVILNVLDTFLKKYFRKEVMEKFLKDTLFCKTIHDVFVSFLSFFQERNKSFETR